MRRLARFGLAAVLVAGVSGTAGMGLLQHRASGSETTQVVPPPTETPPTGTPPALVVDEQDREGTADHPDQEERESENNADDKPGDPGDAPGADHQCPPDCRPGEVG